jgi:hypothetical protein
MGGMSIVERLESVAPSGEMKEDRYDTATRMLVLAALKLSVERRRVYAHFVQGLNLHLF